MTHCDFSVRSAREEMRHIIGSSEPNVTSDLTKTRTWDARRRTKITWSCTKRKRRAAATSCMS